MKTWNTKSGYQLIQILSGRSNVFLLTNGIKNILIDTSPARKWKKLNSNLKSLDINKLDFLILTHTHYDHVANSFNIKKCYNPQVVVQREEKLYISNGTNKFPRGTNPVTRFLINVIGDKISNKYNFTPCQPDILVDSILNLNEFGFNAYLMHTPGHSIGSISLIVDNEIAIVGDTMFGVFKTSIFPPFADNPKVMIDSWGKLLETNCSVFIPAHGFENNREKVKKNYEKRKSDIQRAVDSFQKEIN